MSTNIMLAVASLLGLGLSIADAEARAIRCDTCMNSADFREQAVAAGPGTHIVYNIVNNTIEQYEVGPVADDNNAVGVSVPATGGAAVGEAGAAEQVQSGRQ